MWVATKDQMINLDNVIKLYISEEETPAGFLLKARGVYPEGTFLPAYFIASYPNFEKAQQVLRTIQTELANGSKVCYI